MTVPTLSASAQPDGAADGGQRRVGHVQPHFHWKKTMERVQQGFKRGVAVLVAAVVLATGSPAMAQSSGLLASAETLAMAVEAEQDETVVRRRRSGGLAWTGGALAVAGVVLALRPPVCETDGRGQRDGWTPAYSITYTYHAVHRDGKCDVRATGEYWWIDRHVTSTSYHSDGWDRWSDFYGVFVGDAPVAKKTWNYVGWATAAAGGALLGLGLSSVSSVDVPVRLDVAPGGFSLAHSLGW